jgi:hypothetical protein
MSHSALEACQEWYIYNSQTQEQLGPIDTSALREYLLRLDSVSQDDSLVWCPFWKDWRRGNEALMSLGNFPLPPLRNPPPIDMKKAMSSGPIYPVERKFPRIPGILNVTLLSKGRCYRTRTNSLSMGGMGFVATVPADLFLPSCKAVLSSASASHGIVASLQNVRGRDPDSPIKCVRFEELRGSALTTYIDWLKTFGKETQLAG